MEENKTLKVIELLMSLRAKDSFDDIDIAVGESITNEDNWEIVKQIVDLLK